MRVAPTPNVENPAPRQPPRRNRMGVKIVLGEREPIGLALRRFRKLLERSEFGWESRRKRWFTKATEMRRKKAFRKWYKNRHAMLMAKRAGKQ
jgi:small subunit ribosomal protein S21